jgi:hypothetical protein
MYLQPWCVNRRQWRFAITTPITTTESWTYENSNPHCNKHMHKGKYHAIIDSGISCCVTPYIEDFIHQPTPIQNTTLKGIEGSLTALGRGTAQLKIHQDNTDNIILVIDNVIYAPECPIRLISPQQLHRKSKAKGHENWRNNSNPISRGRYIHMCLPSENQDTHAKLHHRQ